MQKSTVFLLVMALAGAGISAGLLMQLRTERAINADLSERLVHAAARPIAPQPVASLTPELPAVTTPVAAPAPAFLPAPTEPTAENRIRVARGDWQARQRQMMNDPKYREAFREEQRLRLATRREKLIRLIGMSPEQADAVIDLTIEQQMVMQDGQGWSLTHENAQRAKLRELLGEEKSAQLQTYMETRQSRMQVDQFRTQLTGVDVLRDDQVEPLIAALHVERSQMQSDLEEFGRTLEKDSDPRGTRRKYLERETELMQEAYGRMQSSAASILSGTQLQKLEAMLKRDIARHETQLRMQRIQSKFEPASEMAGNSN
jgi:hypothetical protein